MKKEIRISVAVVADREGDELSVYADNCGAIPNVNVKRSQKSQGLTVNVVELRAVSRAAWQALKHDVDAAFAEFDQLAEAVDEPIHAIEKHCDAPSLRQPK